MQSRIYLFRFVLSSSQRWWRQLRGKILLQVLSSRKNHLARPRHVRWRDSFIYSQFTTATYKIKLIWEEAWYPYENMHTRPTPTTTTTRERAGEWGFHDASCTTLHCGSHTNSPLLCCCGSQKLFSLWLSAFIFRFEHIVKPARPTSAWKTFLVSNFKIKTKKYNFSFFFLFLVSRRDEIFSQLETIFVQSPNTFHNSWKQEKHCASRDSLEKKSRNSREECNIGQPL